MSDLAVVWRLAKRVIDRHMKCRPAAAICVGLEALGVLCAGAGPYLLKTLVDLLPAPNERGLGYIALLAVFVGLWTVPSLLSSLRSVYSERINSRLVQWLATGAVRGFLSNGRWRAMESGQVQSLVERLPYSLAIVVDGLIWRTAPMALQLIVGLAVILKLTSAKYLIAIAALSVAFVVVSWLGIRRQTEAAKDFNRSAGLCGGLVGDILRNPRRIVSNGAVDHEVTGVEQAYAGRESAGAAVAWSLVGLSAGQWVTIAVAMTAMLSMAGSDVIKGRATVGDFVLLQAYAFRLILPLAGVGFVLSQSAAALGNLKEALALQTQPGERDLPGAGPDQHGPAEVEVSNLSFRYPGGKAGIDNVSVVFPPASFSVIVGKNGAGKSTLAQLLAGLLKPDQGETTYNGHRIDDLPERARHRQVLYVPQRVSLLNRDLRANLLYPPTRLTEVEAIRRLTTWEFMGGEPRLDLTALVGEGGEALSGGQVQKLELARLLGVDAPCLILDESTSALNPAIEARIIGDLRREVAGKATLIMVAHRLSLAEAADQVLWMERGRLKAVGDHGDLLHFPDYRNLWFAADSSAAL